MVKIDQAEFETIREVLAGAYETLGKSNLPYANVHSALSRLDLTEMAEPYASYAQVSQQYEVAAQQIRETKDPDELRAFLLTKPETAEVPN